jgi:prephenate dehydrogenase
MKIGIVGMGLIGGSLCRAVKQYTQHRVYGMTRNPATVQFALSAGAIDEGLTNLGDMDLTIVALPPEATADFLTKHVGDFQKGAIVTDVCGVKQYIIDTADQLYFDAGVHFIGGHPMAGKETAGFANSDADLYKGASFIVTPTALTSQTALETVKDLMLSIGFSRIATATPAEHDANIAYTSQLAHVVSSAYIKSPTLAKELGFSAGSFQDMTRVAKLDPDMWTSLFRLNREPLLFEINTLISNLTKFRDRLAADDVDAIHDSLNLGRVLRENVLLRQHKS